MDRRVSKALGSAALGVAGTPVAASAQEGGSLLTVDGGLMVWTLFVFGLLFLALKRYAWPELLRANREREESIRKQLAAAEKARADAEATLQEHKKLVAGAKEEATALIDEAKTVAEKEREATLARARQEQEQVLERAKREIEAERERAVSELRQEAVDISLAAASRLVESNLDDAANRKLVEDYLGSLERET